MIAGDIAPAVVTTTAATAGLLCLEALKLVGDREASALRDRYAGVFDCAAFALCILMHFCPRAACSVIEWCRVVSCCLSSSAVVCCGVLWCVVVSCRVESRRLYGVS
jgi:hypothetical protein